MIGGCSAVDSVFASRSSDDHQVATARYIEVEVADLGRGLPCNVVDRTGTGEPKLLWHASYEDGFCHRQAEQTSQALESQGWTCQPQSPREWETPARLADPSSSTILHRVAAWRCIVKLSPTGQVAGDPPNPGVRPPRNAEPEVQQVAIAETVPIPRARQETAAAPAAPKAQEAPEALATADPAVPEPAAADTAAPEPVATAALDNDQAESDPLGDWGTPKLRRAVKKDLETIGQDVVSEQTALDAAVGDLDGDGIDDAIVTLVRTSEQNLRPPMLMAYIGDPDDYSLVDVWILRPLDDPEDRELDLAIENGEVRMSGCCEESDEPTVLILQDRKLAYADGTPR